MMRKEKLVIILLMLVGVYFLFVKKYYPSGKQCVQYSKHILGIQDYNAIWKGARDSLQKWIDVKLVSVSSIRNGSTWQLDRVVCVNNSKDKIIMVLLDASTSYSSLDDIHWLYGIMITGKWYYFFGPDLTIIRSAYQSDSSVPLSFEKLHDLAVEHIFRRYLYQSLFDRWFRPNHWTINEEFFSDLTSVAWGHCETKECWDKRYLEIVKENWSNIDTTNYDRSK